MDADTAERVPAPGSGGLWVLWPLILFLLVSNMLRYSMFPMQQAVQADLHLDDVEMSLVQGLAMSVPVAMLSMSFGRWADRARRSRLIVLLMVTSIAASLLTAAANGFTMLFVARMLSGIGALCALPALFSLAGDLVPAERRGRAMMLFSLGGTLGAGAAFAAGGWLFGVFASLGYVSPWRQVDVALAGAAAVLSMPLLFLKEPPRAELGEAAGARLSAALAELWAGRKLVVPFLVGQTAMGMATIAGLVWTVPILQRGHGLQPQQFAGWMSIVTTTSGIAGAVLGGLMVDRAQGRGGARAVMVLAALVAVAMIPTSSYAIVPDIALLALLLAIYQIFCSAGEVVSNAANILLFPNELRGLVASVGNFLFAIFAMGIAPTSVAGLNVAFGGGDHIGLALLLISVPLALISVMAFRLAAGHAGAGPYGKSPGDRAVS